VGFILADLNLDPIYANLTALDVLTYPDGTEPPTSQASGVRERLRSILNIDTQASYTHPAIFISGKREYVCRPFLLDARDSASRRRIVALLLERTPGGRLDIAEFCRRHRLTARERETLEHLIQGLRTREIAALMNISPNTVKQFIKFIGSKVGASTRSGIVGKVMSS
jgi:DNA-binding CsgD family transcriptional regulator